MIFIAFKHHFLITIQSCISGSAPLSTFRLDCPTACWIPLCGCATGISTSANEKQIHHLLSSFPSNFNKCYRKSSKRGVLEFVQVSYYLISHSPHLHSIHTSNEMQTKPSRLADSTCKIVLLSTASLRKRTINRCQCRDNADVGKQL